MAQITLNSTGVASDGALVLQSNGTTSAVTISTAQNVGIGGASAGEKLEVVGSIQASGGAASFNRSGLILDYQSGSSLGRIAVGPNAGGTLAFYTGNGATVPERMRITDDGQLLVGNTSTAFDSTAYAIVGSGTGDSGLAIYTSNATAGYLQFADGTSGAEEYRGFIKYDHSTNAMSFSTNSSARTEAEMTIDSSGNVLVTSAAGLGYGTGSGGTVTQATSRTTGVTLSKPTGAITMFSAAGSTTAATFTVTNTLVAATDTIILNQKSGTNLYDLLVTAVAAGSFNITFRTTSGTATDAPVINFALIKGVTA